MNAIARGSATTWSLPGPIREPIPSPSLRDRAVGFGAGLVDHLVDYASVAAVISIVGGGATESGGLGGLLGAGAFAALSVGSALMGAIRPTRPVDAQPTFASARYDAPDQKEPRRTTRPVCGWLRAHVPEAGDLLRSEATRSAAILAVSTCAAMPILKALDWPDSWQLALLPGLLVTLTVSVASRHLGR